MQHAWRGRRCLAAGPPCAPFRAARCGRPCSGARGRCRGRALREHVLPTGRMHLVFRLSGPPLRLFRPGRLRCGLATAWAMPWWAARVERFYVRDVVGSPAPRWARLLHPGAAWALFGAPDDALADGHTCAGRALGLAGAGDALERLQAATRPSASRLRCPRGPAAAAPGRPPARHCIRPWRKALAPRRLARTAGAASWCALSGYSHRRFIALFRDATGLAPEDLCGACCACAVCWALRRRDPALLGRASRTAGRLQPTSRT